MPLKTIVVVLLRLYTINIVVQGIVMFTTLLPTIFKLMPGNQAWLSLSIPVASIVVGTILWCATLPLGRLVVKGHDISIATISLTKEDLYNFSFVFAGIWIVLSYINPAVENGYRFFLYDFNLPPSDPEKGRYLVPFIGNLLAIGFGFASALGASKWTRKLLKREKAGEESRDLPN
jgi:hypothetical protein